MNNAFLKVSKLAIALFLMLFIGSHFVKAEGKKMESTIFRFKKGETITISDNFVIRFTGHTHKRTQVGQASPLVVGFELIEKNVILETKYFSVDKDEKLFDWKGFNIEFGKSEYDKFQEIKLLKKN